MIVLFIEFFGLKFDDQGDRSHFFATFINLNPVVVITYIYLTYCILGLNIKQTLRQKETKIFFVLAYS